MTSPDELVSDHGKLVILRKYVTIVYNDLDEINEAASTQHDIYIKAIAHRQAIDRKDRREGFPQMGTVFITTLSDLDISESRNGESDHIIMNDYDLDLFLFDIIAADTTFDWFQINVDYTSFFGLNYLKIGDTFKVQNSTGNDGTYTVTGISISGSFPYGALTIDVAENVASSVADGEIISIDANYRDYVVVDTKDDRHPFVEISKKTVKLKTAMNR